MVYSSLQKKKQHSPSPVRNVVSLTTASNIHVHVDTNQRTYFYDTNASNPQPTIAAALEKHTPLQSSSKRAKYITDAITYFLAKDSIPFNAVERPGFKHLLHVLEPRYLIPANSSFSR